MNVLCKCGSTEGFVREKGSQVGLYCKYCGKWQKWLNKDERNLFPGITAQNPGTPASDPLTHTIKEGARYRHFKGSFYHVICFATHSETKEKMVVCVADLTGAVCVRPYDMFASRVDKQKYPGVKQVWRFEEVADDGR